MPLRTKLEDSKAIVQNLIKSTDINARDKMGNTPLILAIEKGHKEIAKLLIDGGADLNVTNNILIYSCY